MIPSCVVDSIDDRIDPFFVVNISLTTVGRGKEVDGKFVQQYLSHSVNIALTPQSTSDDEPNQSGHVSRYL